MTEKSISYRRHAMGIIGLIAIAMGIYFWCFPPQSASLEFLHGSCIKVGSVLLVAWLAFPQLDRLPWLWFGGGLSVLLIVATRPRAILILLKFAVILLPILFLIWLFKPRSTKTVS